MRVQGIKWVGFRVGRLCGSNQENPNRERSGCARMDGKLSRHLPRLRIIGRRWC